MKLVEHLQSERMTDKSDTLEAEILNVVLGLEDKVDQGILRNGLIAEKLNSGRPEKLVISPQRLGKRLAALGFKRGKVGKDRGILWNEEYLDRLKVSYGVC